MSATEATLSESKDTSALESVRRLEERLDDRHSTEEAAKARVAAAREVVAMVLPARGLAHSPERGA